MWYAPSGSSLWSRPEPAAVAERIIAIAGSLRRGSLNRALIRAAQELAPDGMAIDTLEIGELPF